MTQVFSLPLLPPSHPSPPPFLLTIIVVLHCDIIVLHISSVIIGIQACQTHVETHQIWRVGIDIVFRRIHSQDLRDVPVFRLKGHLDRRQCDEGCEGVEGDCDGVIGLIGEGDFIHGPSALRNVREGRV